MKDANRLDISVSWLPNQDLEGEDSLSASDWRPSLVHHGSIGGFLSITFWRLFNPWKRIPTMVSRDSQQSAESFKKPATEVCLLFLIQKAFSSLTTFIDIIFGFTKANIGHRHQLPSPSSLKLSSLPSLKLFFHWQDGLRFKLCLPRRHHSFPSLCRFLPITPSRRFWHHFSVGPHSDGHNLSSRQHLSPPLQGVGFQGGFELQLARHCPPTARRSSTKA